MFWGDLQLSDGLDSGHWFWGTTLYLAVLLTVLGKAALISEYVAKYTNKMALLKGDNFYSIWTKYTVAGEW